MALDAALRAVSLLLAAVVLAGAQGDARTCISRLASVDAACCATENDCTGGVPDTCTEACAHTWIPYYTECRKTLDSIADLDAAASAHLFDVCTATVAAGEAGDEGGCQAESDALLAQMDDLQHEITGLRRQLSTLVSAECCEETPWSDEARGRDEGDVNFGTAVCGLSPQTATGCASAVGWSAATDLCLSKGARLCSLAELTNGEAHGTGCGFDSAPLLWSSSTGDCPPGSAMAGSSTASQLATANDPDGAEVARCIPVASPLPVRCCADYCGTAASAHAGSGGAPSTVPSPPSPPPAAAAADKPPRLPPPAGGVPYGTAPGARAAAAPPRGAKNVLMIMVDDLRPGAPLPRRTSICLIVH
jgi:hypothetical protein